MIRLTRLNGVPMFLNADLIEHIDVTPDTVITLTTGQILRAKERAEEVVDLIVDFRRRVFCKEGTAGLHMVSNGAVAGTLIASSELD